MKKGFFLGFMCGAVFLSLIVVWLASQAPSAAPAVAPVKTNTNVTGYRLTT
ncbi:hypothetical protein [Herbaspirillum autotrophicum]|uniref:hypothetical protein n=1 Tax=Herbaspirillum autotrophicum TaxID=180195 RepID=UPI000AB19B8C|nr:hypothetical protein [Herbaspirillum autotrophicum]